MCVRGTHFCNFVIVVKTNLMGLIQQLKQDGVEKGLCQEWQNKLKEGVSMKRLVNLYVRGIDFCVGNDYPTLDFIRENFKGKCEPYGVFVDEKELQLLDVPDVVLQGECKGILTYDGYSVCRAYIRHSSDVTIKVSGNAHLTVDVFDDVTMKLDVVGSNARVLVNKYGDARVEFSGVGVKVVSQNKKTY